MARRHRLGLCLAVLVALTSTAVACSSSAAPAPTSPPKQEAKATEAPKTAATAAPAPAKPTEAPKAAEPTKAAAPAVSKPVDWPKKPVTLIVPSDAGGATDIGYRLLAPRMEKYLGTAVEVVNKPGAGTQVGVTELSKAKPDGYTIGVTLIPQTPTIYMDPERKAVFNRESFVPIGLHVFDPGLIAVAPDSKYKTLKDVVDDAKANREKVKAATTGILSDDHLSILQLQRLTDVRFAIVHFTGGAPQSTALLGGHIDVGFENVGLYASQKKAGKVRILAVMDRERSKFMPDVPTAEEQGFKLYSSSNRPLSAPAGTPKEIVWFISWAMEQAMKDPELIAKMDEANLTQKYMNPDQLLQFWKDFDENQVKPLMEMAREK